MKPQWQRQQEQMRRQQEQMRQQQMQAAWQEQQKAKQQRPETLPQEEQEDEFARVEAQVAKLRRQMAAGHLTEEQFKAQLREMMVQDATGTWWMVGFESGTWYRHDGADWVRADPGGRPSHMHVQQPTARPAIPVKPQPRRFWGCVVLLLGLILTFGAGVGAMEVALEVLEGDLYDFVNGTAICAIVIWIAGLVVTITVTRKVWRRE